MWNRESNNKSFGATTAAAAATPPAAHTPAPVQPLPPTPVTPPAPAVAKGSTLVLRGELTGSEDLVLEGRVEGRISLPEHVLTIGLGAEVSAEVSARIVILHGRIEGNVTASERVEVWSTGRMHGDLVSPKVQLADGATFTGRLETRKPGKQDQKSARSEMVA